MKKPIIKGKLTAISMALLAVLQTPEIMADLLNAGVIFSGAAETGLDVGKLIASAGVIYGAIRRACGYFKNVPRVQVSVVRKHHISE